jgi:hypothetical protein
MAKKMLATNPTIMEDELMIPTEHPLAIPASVGNLQIEWVELKSKVAVLEAGQEGVEREIKALRLMLERTIEHRQKSHSELVLILAGLVSKLPINDIGFTVAKLVEHNAHVSEILTTLIKGKAEENLPQPASLKLLEQTQQELAAAVKPAVEELLALEVPFEPAMLTALITQPELFFTPKMIRANRCFVKGQVPRERIVKEFGEEALVFFNDLTTDAKLNPRPKTEDILLGFKVDFPVLFQQQPALIPDKREALLSLHRTMQQSKAATETARAQKRAFAKLSFLLELLHYYKNRNTEMSEGLYAQRLPGLVEQMVISGSSGLDEKLIASAEGLLAFIINLDHRQMVVNNVGKSGDLASTLKFVLKFRTENLPQPGPLMHEFIKHLVPAQKAAPTLAVVLRLIRPEMQKLFVQMIKTTDRLPRAEAEALAKALRADLGLAGMEMEAKASSAMPPETEKQLAWENIKELILKRADPAIIAAAIRDRLHHKYDADELKQSWMVLIESDVMTLIKTFCQIPYLPDGTTDAIARNVMETYVIRLTHEKYAATYHKVVNSLKSMIKANPGNAMPFNFISLIKWVDPESAKKLTDEVQLPAVQ